MTCSWVSGVPTRPVVRSRVSHKDFAPDTGNVGTADPASDMIRVRLKAVKLKPVSNWVRRHVNAVVKMNSGGWCIPECAKMPLIHNVKRAINVAAAATQPTTCFHPEYLESPWIFVPTTVTILELSAAGLWLLTLSFTICCKSSGL
ncbi:hypothetical protein K438DRAFT_1767953 [Mycena galopus ATCC 62051]|nr:hypothetical protein K438DRAFT_1767953 [Mycena galopus ATCC 62051]